MNESFYPYPSQMAIWVSFRANIGAIFQPKILLNCHPGRPDWGALTVEDEVTIFLHLQVELSHGASQLFTHFQCVPIAHKWPGHGDSGEAENVVEGKVIVFLYLYLKAVTKFRNALPPFIVIDLRIKEIVSARRPQ